MKLVVFAHVPPPHHSQAVMVKLMLDGLREGKDIEVFHVDARVSDDIGDVGGIRPGKILRLFEYCAQAIWFRLRYGADTLYYVPAPGSRFSTACSPALLATPEDPENSTFSTADARLAHATEQEGFTVV